MSARTITMRFEVPIDAPSEVQAKARMLVVGLLAEAIGKGALSPEEQAIAEALLNMAPDTE